MHRATKLGERRGSWRTSARWALLGLLLATPLRAEELETVEIPEEWTQPLSFLESGILVNTDDSYRFGDYTGIREDQVYYLGDMDLWRRAPWNDETPWFWRLRGANLGLASRRTRVDAGLQGVMGLRLYFDQLPKNQVNDGGVFYGGNSSLVLPAGWVADETVNGPAAGMTTLPTSLRDPKVKHERRRSGAALMLDFTPDWTMEFRADRDAKDGSKLMGVTVGNSGGNPRSVLVNEPIDYTTNNFDVFLRNAAERSQMEFGLHYSSFENGDDRFPWQVAYLIPDGAGTPDWAPGTDFAAGAVASKGLAPDNDAYQLSFAGGYDLPLAATRVTLNAAYGRMEQDQSFQPYSINTALWATPPPRTSLDGEIETTFLSLGFASRPLPRLSLHGRYRADDRDNHSSQDTYNYVSGDSALQGSSTADSRINHPYSYRSDQVEFGTDYDLGRRTNLGVDYAFERIERDFSEVDKTRENRVEAHLTSRLAKGVQLRLKGGYAARKGSTYDGAAPYVEGHSFPTAPFENHPELRRYYLADRMRTELTGQLNFMPSEVLTLGLSTGYVDDDYDDTNVGLTDNQRTSAMLDVSYDPLEQLHTYLFYTYELLEYDQNGWSWTNPADTTNVDLRWDQKIRDDIHTVGAGARTSVLDGRLEFGLDYLFTHSATGIEYGAGTSVSGFGTTGLPDNTTQLQSAQISADYHLNERITLRLGYLFEKFDWKDWAYDGVTVQSINNVITLGSGTPDDHASLFLFSLRYELP